MASRIGSIARENVAMRSKHLDARGAPNNIAWDATHRYASCMLLARTPGWYLWGLVVPLLFGCRSPSNRAELFAQPTPNQDAKPSVVATAQTTMAMELPISNSEVLAGCPVGVSCEQAIRDLDRANQLIARAGEHPMDGDLDEILPLLQRAADTGYLPAQFRFGGYVVGYWYTDEMFWPKRPKIAIAALAMLRVACKRSPNVKGTLERNLARDPVKFSDSDGLPPLPQRWVKAALAEAARWEKAHPSAGSTGP